MGSDLYTFKDQTAEPAAKGGTLAGKRIVIQPNISVRGWPTTAGSLALDGFMALEDATVITRLKKAGASVIGSSRMSELGFGLAGETMGEVLSSNEADIGLATDTMGEARLIASGHGLFGFKPSYGIVSRFGLIGLVPSMESYGVVAKDPNDMINTMSAIAGRDGVDVSMSDEDFPEFSAARQPSGSSLTVGIVKECLQILNEKEREAFRAGLAKLEGAGITLREVELADYDLLPVVHNVIASVEASSAAGKYDGVRYGHRSSSGKNWNDMYLNTRGEAFGSLIKAFLFQGAYFQFENYASFENACRIRNRLVRTVDGLFDQVDLLALPTERFDAKRVQPETISEVYNVFLLTLAANVTGLPALHVPSLAGDGEADRGMQLVGPRLGDARVLSVGVTLSSLPAKGETA